MKQTNARGFTLIELLLYISISAGLLLAISFFLALLLQSRVKNQTTTEVEQQGLQVIQLVTQAIRSAAYVSTPATSTSALSLTIATPTSTTTTFDLFEGVVRITEGGGAPLALTNRRVVVSNLSFTNLSRASTPGTLQVQFVISSVGTSSRNEFSYSKIFTGSATLRHP